MLVLRRGVAVAVVAAALVALTSSAPSSQVRLVAAAQSGAHAAGAHAVATSTSSSRWTRYLASDAACPGSRRSDLAVSAQVRSLACLVNWARKARGLPPLASSATLDLTSLLKARDIVRCRAFLHNPCGGTWSQHLDAIGYSGNAGENLYLAAGRWSAPRAAVDGWLNSDEHRANLFDPRWRRQGIAVISIGTYAGQPGTIVWVNEFGDR